MKVEQDYDVKDFIRNGETRKPPDVTPDEFFELQEVILILKEAKDLLNAYSAEINKRLQESWSVEQAGIIIKRVDDAQEKLDSYMRKEATTTKKNPKEDVDGGIKLEVNEEAVDGESAELQYLEQIASDLDPFVRVDLDDTYGDELDEDYLETPVKQERKSPSQIKITTRSESYVKIECFICEKTFLGQLHLKQHYSECHNEVSFECKICGKLQPNIMKYRKHYYHHPEVKKRAPREMKCRLCDEVFLGSHNLKLHYEAHGPGPYECPWCGKQDQELLKIIKHTRSHTDAKMEVKCYICDEVFMGKSNYHTHRKKFHAKAPFVCKLCGIEKPSVAALQTHLREHPLYEMVECEICAKKMQRKVLDDHMGYHTGENMSECRFCKKIHPKAFMSKHMKTRHPEEITTGYKCNLCEKTFVSSIRYSKHMKTHPDYKQHYCKMCEKGFISAGNLRSHNISAHGMTANGHTCSVCGRTFHIESFLKYHMRVHTGEKPYKCEFCPKAFRIFRQKKVHLRTHTGERPFQCDKCENTFVQSAHLKTHQKTVHEGIKMPSGVSAAMCGTCGKSFYSKQTLRNHERAVHTGNRPFKCEHCDKSFATSKAHEIHQETHRSTKDFSCDEEYIIYFININIFIWYYH